MRRFSKRIYVRLPSKEDRISLLNKLLALQYNELTEHEIHQVQKAGRQAGRQVDRQADRQTDRYKLLTLLALWDVLKIKCWVTSPRLSNKMQHMGLGLPATILKIHNKCN